MQRGPLIRKFAPMETSVVSEALRREMQEWNLRKLQRNRHLPLPRVTKLASGNCYNSTKRAKPSHFQNDLRMKFCSKLSRGKGSK